MASDNKQLVYPSPDGGETETQQINDATMLLSQATKLDYSYSHLPEGYIRLLRLLPHHDKTAAIQCDVFCYPLLKLGGGTPHLYSALSYARDCAAEKNQYVSIGSRKLLITANLYAALLRLRDGFLERILWVDAICLDKGNLKERRTQAHSMAMIYNMASCVIVWLGESESNSGQAMEGINKAADGQHIEDKQTLHQAILQLLQREWFKCIWVLQEIAAARSVLLICGPTEIDGYIFCLGLKALNLGYADHPDLQSLIHPTTYLIRRAIFRSKHATVDEAGRSSINIRPLAELVDMYHTRKASDRRDKVYALLGMCSDNHSSSALSPDDNISWKELFLKLIQLILGDCVSATTWDDQEIAVVKSQGYVLGQVSSVRNDNTWNDTQTVFIRKKDGNGPWTLQASARSIEEGDIVCLLQGASNPMIIRLVEDQFAIIRIAINPPMTKQDEIASNHASSNVQSTECSLHDFILVWDWGTSKQQEEKKHSIRDRRLEYTSIELESLPDDTARIMNTGRILQDAGSFDKATDMFQKAIKVYKEEFGDEDLHTLTAVRELAVVYKKTYRHREGEKLEVMADLVGRSGEYNQITEKGMMHMARLFDKDVIELLLDRRGDEAIITGKILKAAIQNSDYSEVILALLLEEPQHQIAITEEVIEFAAQHSTKAIMELLLKKRRDRIHLTERVISALLQNQHHGNEILRQLLSQREEHIATMEAAGRMPKRRYEEENSFPVRLVQQSDQIIITKRIIKTVGEVSKGGRFIALLKGEWIMPLLLDQHQYRLTFTEEAMIAVAGLSDSGITMRLLLEKRPCQIAITKEFFKAAVTNPYNHDILPLLLAHKEGQITITEEIIKVALRRDCHSSQIQKLLDWQGDQITVTKQIINAGRSWSRGKEAIEMLIRRPNCQIKFTKETISAIADILGKDMLIVLLDERGGKTPTEELVEAAAWCSERLLSSLLSWRGGKITITEEVVKAAAENDTATVSLLLTQRGDQIIITESILNAAAGNMSDGMGVLKYLLDHRGDEITITESVIKAAAGNIHQGVEIMRFLLDQRGDQVIITEDIIEAAAGNGFQGVEIMRLLLNQRGNQVTITEGVLKAAIRSGNRSVEIMGLLLDQRGDQVIITEGVLKVAASYGLQTAEMMRLLLDQRGDQVIITEELIKAISGGWYGNNVMFLLLRERRNQIAITEDVLKVMAGNHDEKIIARLLNEQGEQVVITEEVAQVAARNQNAKVMEILLDRFTVTEEVAKTVARDSQTEMMELLITRQGDRIVITEEIINAAKQNPSKEMMLLLLDRQRRQNNPYERHEARYNGYGESGITKYRYAIEQEPACHRRRKEWI